MSQIASEWREIKQSDGRTMYFNKNTGISVYEKPQALRMLEERGAGESNQGGKSQNGASQQPSHATNVKLGESLTGPGAAIRQRPSGASMSTAQPKSSDEELKLLFAQKNLNIPRGFQVPSQFQGTDAESLAYASGQDPTQYMDTVLKTAYQTDQREIYPAMNYFRTEEKTSDVRKFRNYENLTKEDAVMVFKDVLKDMGVSTSWKWEDANRVIQNDPRVKALKTISERKQAYNDYITEMKNKERTDARQRRQQQREGFMELLREQKHLHSLSKYYQVVRTLQSDPRFKNVDEKDREEIFQDYLDELVTKEREEKREQSEKRIESLKVFFQEREVPLTSKWREVEELFKDDPAFISSESLEQITAYEDYIKQQERNEFQQKKHEKRRIERKHREAYEQLLRELLDKRTLNHRTKWRDFVKQYKDDPRYYNLVGQPGSTPHELFQDALNEEKEILKQHKPQFKSLIKSNGIRFPSNVSFENFDQSLTKYNEYSKLDIKTRKLLHEYYLYKVKQKEQEKAKKLAKSIKSLERFLRSTINLNKSQSYEDYKNAIDKQIDFTSISEEIRHKTFNDVLHQLNQSEQAKKNKRKSRSRSSSSSSAESGEVKMKKNKKRHQSRSSSESDEEGEVDKSHHKHHRKTSDSRSETKKKKHH